MGLNILKSFVRAVRNGANVTDVKCDPGGGNISTAEHFSAPGDDSFPLTTDTPVTVPVPGSGRKAAVGYNDPVSTPKAAAGEKRIYSRNSGGTVMAEAWLKNDGTIVSENSSVSSTLAADGSATIDNGIGSVEIAAGGSVTLTSGSGSVAILPDGTITAAGPIGSLVILPDGTITGLNALGLFSLLPTGVFTANGANITALGDYITNDGVSLKLHTHAQPPDTNGDTEAETLKPTVP